jgi:hypothetical protein
MPQDHVDVEINVADLASVRWPDRPLVGDGAPMPVAVPLPTLPLMRVHTVLVPLGAGAAERIATVARLRRFHKTVVIPPGVVLLLAGPTFGMLGLFDVVENGRDIGRVFLIAGLLLGLVGYVLDLVAALTKTPRVVGRHPYLRLPSAHADVVREAVALNPPGLIRTR